MQSSSTKSCRSDEQPGKHFYVRSLSTAPRVRGAAWVGRGDPPGSQEILPAWGAGDAGSNPDGPIPIRAQCRFPADDTPPITSRTRGTSFCRTVAFVII